MFTGAINMPCH